MINYDPVCAYVVVVVVVFLLLINFLNFSRLTRRGI